MIYLLLFSSLFFSFYDRWFYVIINFFVTKFKRLKICFEEVKRIQREIYGPYIMDPIYGFLGTTFIDIFRRRTEFILG